MEFVKKLSDPPGEVVAFYERRNPSRFCVSLLTEKTTRKGDGVT